MEILIIIVVIIIMVVCVCVCVKERERERERVFSSKRNVYDTHTLTHTNTHMIV